MITVRMHIGVDIGKEWLDVCYPDGKKEHVKNIKSCRTKLIAKAAKIGAIVSFEATGPMKNLLPTSALRKASGPYAWTPGVRGAMPNPRDDLRGRTRLTAR